MTEARARGPRGPPCNVQGGFLAIEPARDLEQQAPGAAHSSPALPQQAPLSLVEPAPELTALRAELRALEQRVELLERKGTLPIEAAGTAREIPTDAARSAREIPVETAAPQRITASDGASTFGRALLGIAGAYALRALTELGWLSKSAGVLAAFLYAMAWLWFATRTAREKRLTVLVNAATALVILSPMVWEATLRMNIISAGTAGAMLAAFSLAAQAMVWRNRLSIVATLTALATSGMSLVLLLGTNDLLPFVFALLVIAVGAEVPARRDGVSGPRWIIAAAVDLAMLITVLMLKREGGLPQGYAPVALSAVFAAQALMVAIYVSGILPATAGRLALSAMNVIQTAAALVLGVGGFYLLGNGSPAMVAGIGAAALAGAAGFYFLSFENRLAENRSAQAGRERDSAIFGWFGFTLALAASALLFSGFTLAAVWCLLAVAAGRARRSFDWTAVQMQNAGFLLIASGVSGIWIASASQLFGSGMAPLPLLAIAIVITATLLIYPMGPRAARPNARQRVALALIAANLTWLLAGAVSRGLETIWRRAAGGASPTALATAVLVGLSFALAIGSWKWQRRELVWVVYATMAVGALKLAVIDFAQGATLSMVASLLLYGAGLIRLPRILARVE